MIRVAKFLVICSMPATVWAAGVSDCGLPQGAQFFPYEGFSVVHLLWRSDHHIERISAAAPKGAKGPLGKAAAPKRAEAAPRAKESFDKAAKPAESRAEKPGDAGGGKKGGGSGDPPPSAQPVPPARPVFKPPSI